MGKVNYMMTAQDVADALGCSVGKAYKVIKSLNDELKEMGYITVAGKLPKAYWAEKCMDAVNEKERIKEWHLKTRTPESGRLNGMR